MWSAGREVWGADIGVDLDPDVRTIKGERPQNACCVYDNPL